jgi:predicted  nucleic acid-binding Zn-ribbon protein
MSRIQHLARPKSGPLKWKMALPILGLAVFAAFHAHGASAQPTGQRTAAHSLTYVDGRSRDDAYALVRDTDHGTNMSGNSADWKEIDAVKRNIHGEFLWFRDGGKTWVVQDPDILSRANAAWAPVDDLGKQMDAYGQQMDGHGKNMEALGHDMERAAQAASQFHDERKTREFERKMNELSRQMARLGARMGEADGAQRKDLESEMEKLGARMEKLGERLGAEQESAASVPARASMEELGRKMHEASRPMNELGKKMGALGKRMEKESKAADKVVRQLIREAREKGLARPAPAAT